MEINKLIIDNGTIKDTKQHKYFGVRISNDGKFEIDILQKIGRDMQYFVWFRNINIKPHIHKNNQWNIIQKIKRYL